MQRCTRCNEPLPHSARSDARYCSPACRQADYRERTRLLSPDSLAAAVDWAAHNLSAESAATVRMLAHGVTDNRPPSRNSDG